MISRNEKTQIDKLRLIVQEAENTGNLDLMVSILADDVTVVIPGTPPVKGKADATAFLKSWFEDVEIQIKYIKKEIQVSGELAYEWAIYTQETTNRKTGKKAGENGRIVWVYKKYDEKWLQHFVIWNTI